MFRRIFIALLIIFAALSAGWLAMRRGDIPYETLEAQYANAASKFLTLDNGLIVHYRVEGPEAAPVIMLVHGFSSSLHTWDAWAEDLQTDFRVVRFDLPGHGLTRTPDVSELTTETLAGFVDDMANALDLDQFVLVGSSMGGNTAWRYALDHENRLEGLVLVAASGLPETEKNDKRPIVFDLITNPLIGPLLVDLDITPLIRDGVEKSFIDQSLVTEDMIERYAALARAPGHRKALLTLATRKNADAAAQAEKLQNLNVPTLILFGNEDAVVPPSFGERFRALIPRSELITYEGVGHLPQEEVADKSVKDVRRFVCPDSSSAAGSEPALPVEGVPCAL